MQHHYPLAAGATQCPRGPVVLSEDKLASAGLRSSHSDSTISVVSALQQAASISTNPTISSGTNNQLICTHKHGSRTMYACYAPRYVGKFSPE